LLLDAHPPLLPNPLPTTDGPHDLSKEGQAMYKTRLCINWGTSGACRRGDACSFAHGDGRVQYVHKKEEKEKPI
jgi:hypothetical protein